MQVTHAIDLLSLNGHDLWQRKQLTVKTLFLNSFMWKILFVYTMRMGTLGIPNCVSPLVQTSVDSLDVPTYPSLWTGMLPFHRHPV